ncbi:SseB family protein [Mucilaginibacter sp. AK015]|uniref:SseB family protein n=1 Tax=Mucilaginibacter sp. AK015 TaxID=2723072 RepID=UPI00161B9DC4|nr:SseB family protein [Mucilaginibacter sp. AK015]MBB5395530.1 hypothetical protein [Mucilaginibacter sp. AK015]
MGILNSLFRKEDDKEPYEGPPENRALINYIADWYKTPNDENYKKTVLELMEGRPVLLLPSANKVDIRDKWQVAKEDTMLNLTSIFTADSIKVLGAFTDEAALLNWTGKSTVYTAMHSNDVLLLCEKNGISRLVINSNAYNMFILQRSRGDVQTHPIPAGTTVRVGTPERPLPKRILEKIISGFKANTNINEGYQYLTSFADQYSLVVGVVLAADSQDARAAVSFILQDALRGEELEQPVDAFFLQDAEWLQTVRQIPGSKFYTK